MLKIFKSYSAKTSLLDDFDFYENREKLFRSQRSTKHTSPEVQEVYGNDNYHVCSISLSIMLLKYFCNCNIEDM